ncbi:aldo/keto reductase [Saccharothrix luteola]|uniref:aldo/keto reductase n=1 Tax=Saccharothrix luteola TaxID=2893018 RepID=UPI001E602E55|nr:aldo/keto reductase [Saccharothrix luteola]MCC8246433.1 aldo/keto reductase [Saccharothrix luteola]
MDFALPGRALGGLTVGAQGLGCLSTTGFYGPADADESVATIRQAIDLGVTLLDTADVQGMGAGERLLGRALRGRRDHVVVATKVGMVRAADGNFAGLCGEPAHVRAACAASLRRLGVDHIDLYYQHWVDPTVPVEDTVGALAGLVSEGKVRHLGLSEPGPDDIRRAHAVHPLAAVQSEWSVWTRDLEAGVLPVCRELGIGLVACSPLGRGFLTGHVTSAADLHRDDFRRTIPRFAPGNLRRNLPIVAVLAEVAARRGCTPAQVALAWLARRGPDVVAIPGTARRGHLRENVAALAVELSVVDLAELDAVGPAHGARYGPAMAAMTGP